MAEAALGVISGGFAVASLAIQLIEVAQKLHCFWETLEATDSIIERIKDHLLLMQIVSANIVDISNEESNITCGDGVVKSLDICKTRTERLQKQVQRLASDGGKSQPRRGWATLKTALKDKTIQKIEDQLRGDVAMLLLALQPFFQ